MPKRSKVFENKKEKLIKLCFEKKEKKTFWMFEKFK